jgi:hypothetical protein
MRSENDLMMTAFAYFDSHFFLVLKKSYGDDNHLNLSIFFVH